MIKKIFGGISTKVTIGVILALLLVAGGLYWRMDSLSDDNQSLRVANEEYRASLEDADKTIEKQRRDIKNLENIMVSIRDSKEQIDKDRTSLREALEDAINSDKEFKECMGVKLPPEYLEEVQSE